MNLNKSIKNYINDKLNNGYEAYEIISIDTYKGFKVYSIDFKDWGGTDYIRIAVVNDRNDYLNKVRGFNLNRASNQGVCFHNDIDEIIWGGK